MDATKNFEPPQDSDLRILIFTATYFVLDGVTLTIRRLESHLRSRGALVKICTCVSADMDAELTKDVIIVPGIKIPFAQAGTGYAIGVGLDASTIQKIEEFAPTCIHFTVPDFVGLDGVRYCQSKNIPYIGTWHSNYMDYLKYYYIEWLVGATFHRYLKGFFQQIPVIYVPTRYMLNRLHEWGYDSCTELREWGRGIDLKLFSPERRSNTFRLSHGIQATDVVVLWVGRLVPEKRVDIWINVIKRLQHEGLSVRAMVVGSGTFEKTLSAISRVTCCGWLSGTALAEAYASADILLFPSDVETFGNVTLEALASGCCCVVERKCGEHLVQHEQNGFTCRAGDFEDFYQATRRIVCDPELRLKMSINARQSAWKYERSKILQQMLENYKDAIKRHSDPNYMKQRLATIPEASGRNFLSFICCNYWGLKTIIEPLLTISHMAQIIILGTTDCINHSRNKVPCLQDRYSNNMEEGQTRASGRNGSCCDEDEDDKKIKKTQNKMLAYIYLVVGRIAHYFTLTFSAGLILVFVYAAFTV